MNAPRSSGPSRGVLFGGFTDSLMRFVLVDVLQKSSHLCTYMYIEDGVSRS